MIKLSLSACAVVLAFASFSQSTAKLSGKITNPSSDKVYLFTTSVENGKRKQTYLDSAKLDAKGAFSMSAKVDKTTEATFYDGNESMVILLSPKDNMSLSLNTKFFDETMRFSGVGADKNNAKVVLYLVDETNNAALFAMDMEKVDTSVLFKMCEENAKNYRGLISDYMAEIPDFKTHGEQLLKNEEDKTSQIKDYLKSELAFRANIKALVGKTAIDFEGTDLNGKTTKLSDYKGKMIVVDFWATWCGPCKAEFPAYKALEEKYGEEINFVSVGAFCEEKAWNKMATNEGFKHNIFLSKETEKQIAEYRVNFIPRYLVIDENFVLIDANADRPSSGNLERYWVK